MIFVINATQALGDPTTLAVNLGFALVVTTLVVGMHLRMTWARWGTGAMCGVSFLANLVTLLRSADASSAHAAGQVMGSVIGSALLLVLAWRVVFGEPSRAYFARKSVVRSDADPWG